jgi:drug/metabolite transporter (DMT)-like permease
MSALKYSYIAMIGWGFWAIGSKLLSKHLNAESLSFWISVWSFFALAIFIFFKKSLIVNQHSLLALPVGLFSLVAILAFYKALQIGPTSVVVCLTNLYLLFPVIFGFVYLKEPITITRVLGIVLAISASILLSV